MERQHRKETHFDLWHQSKLDKIKIPETIIYIPTLTFYALKIRDSGYINPLDPTIYEIEISALK